MFKPIITVSITILMLFLMGMFFFILSIPACRLSPCGCLLHILPNFIFLQYCWNCVTPLLENIQTADVAYEVQMMYLFFFFSGHSVQLAGSKFPTQGSKPGHGSESAESYPLDRRGSPRWCASDGSACDRYLGSQGLRLWVWVWLQSQNSLDWPQSIF